MRALVLTAHGAPDVLKIRENTPCRWSVVIEIRVAVGTA